MSGIPYLTQDEIDTQLQILHEKYRNIDPTADSAKEIYSECMNMLGGSMFMLEVDVSKNELWFFRIRVKSSFNNENEIFDPSQHSYVPVEYCSKHGRCHVKGRPVFYGSGSVHCAVKEMQQKNERRYILSIWKLPPQDQLSAVKFFHGTNLASNLFKAYKEKSLLAAYEQHSYGDQDKKENIRRLAEAWSNIFTHENHTISASIAHQLLYGTPTNGMNRMIMYPSVQTREDANYVMHPFLSDRMELYRIVEVDVNPPMTGKHRWIQVCDASALGQWRAAQIEDYPLDDPLMPHTRD